MKNLIIQALNEALTKLEKQVPQTKIKVIEIDLTEKDIAPIDLVNFMKDNNIPDNAYFSTTYEETAISNYIEPCLCYDVNTPTTEEDKTKFKRKRFQTIAFKLVYDSLTANNYKRIGADSKKLRDYNNTTSYDMFINKEFDKLVNFYSLFFTLK